MCSILAILDAPPAADLRERGIALSRFQRHRGPDWSGVHFDGQNLLVHERLAIVDVDGGAQPILHPSSGAALAVNGEIYNHRELRAQLRDTHAFTTGSDCEVILALYTEEGAGFLDRLNGIFAFVLTDPARSQAMVARDPIGVIPLYWGHDEAGTLHVASEMKALIPACVSVSEFPPGHVWVTGQDSPVRYHERDWMEYDRFNELEELVQMHDGYTAEARAGAVLEGLGIPTEVHRQPLSTLSGGFKLRVLLAQVLASAPDILFLDEPTNHLDILSIRWLEGFLKEFVGPAVVISHDHRFLDNISTSILDVDYDTVTLYKGDYSDFVAGKAAERERREKDIVGRKKEIAHQMEFVDRFKAKASKARQAQSKLRMIERKAESIVELAQSSRRYPTFRFQQKRPSGKEVVTIEGIRKSYGDNEVLHGVDLKVFRGDRMAIMGPNGIGKSTLLKILMGQVEPDAGTVEWGYETHPGYFEQDHKDDFEAADRTAEEFIWDYCPDKDIGWVRGAMALMLFTGQDSQKRLKALSGGEAARLVFSKLMLLQPNILVLDEPTNHLDLESIEALVEGLQTFKGTLILVSHDRWFVGQLATRVVEISATGIRDYLGTYDEYVHFCGDDHLDVDRVVLKAKREKKKQRKADSKDDQRGRGGPSPEVEVARRRKKLEARAEELLTELEQNEARVAEIDALFCQEGYYDRTPEAKVLALNEERASLKDGGAKVTAEWEEVGEELDDLS